MVAIDIISKLAGRHVCPACIWRAAGENKSEINMKKWFLTKVGFSDSGNSVEAEDHIVEELVSVE